MLSISSGQYGQRPQGFKAASYATRPQAIATPPDLFFSGRRPAQESANALVKDLDSLIRTTAPKDIDFHTSQRIYYPTPANNQSCPSFEARFNLGGAHYEVNVSQLGDIKLRKETPERTEEIQQPSAFRKNGQTTYKSSGKSIDIETPPHFEHTCRHIFKVIQEAKRKG